MCYAKYRYCSYRPLIDNFVQVFKNQWLTNSKQNSSSFRMVAYLILRGSEVLICRDVTWALWPGLVRSGQGWLDEMKTKGRLNGGLRRTGSRGSQTEPEGRESRVKTLSNGLFAVLSKKTWGLIYSFFCFVLSIQAFLQSTQQPVTQCVCVCVYRTNRLCVFVLIVFWAEI